MFDLDGTLVDSVPLFATIINGMLEDRGATTRVTEAQTRPHATAGGLATVQALLGEHRGVPEDDLADFRRRYGDLSTPPESLYAGVREALSALDEEGVALSVWSNKAQHLCEKVLADLGLVHLFSAIVGTSDDVPLKPDITGLDRALALAGSDRSQACFVGDSDMDHESARRAGLPFIMVTHGYGDYDRVWPDTIMIGGFAEVPGAVRRSLLQPRFA